VKINLPVTPVERGVHHDAVAREIDRNVGSISRLAGETTGRARQSATLTAERAREMRAVVARFRP
jgi:hypothetical protein